MPLNENEDRLLPYAKLGNSDVEVEKFHYHEELLKEMHLLVDGEFESFCDENAF